MIRNMLHLTSILLLLLGTMPARAADETPRLGAVAARARELADRLQAALDPDQQGRVTMAVGITDAGQIIVASSETGTLRRAVLRMVQAEAAEVASGTGHAEVKIVNYVGTTLFDRHARLLVVAAGRPICEECEKAIIRAGAKPASPCKSGRRYP